jgi:hypothetical protein
LAEKATQGPLLFDHLPSALGLLQETYQMLHRTNEAEDRNMRAIQSWSGLPEHIKRQAAPEMLRGVEWHFWGVPVMNPGKEELLRWLPDSARQFLELLERGNRGNLVRTTSIALEKRQIVKATPTLAKTAPPTVYRSNRDKGRDVEAALRANPAKSNREIARETGTTHPFVAKRRRKLESVTASKERLKC